MDANQALGRGAHALWQALGGLVTLWALYYLIAPITLVNGLALLVCVLAFVALVYFKRRINMLAVFATSLLLIAITIASPLTIPGRVYFAPCETMAMDCLTTQRVTFNERSATVYPVADPLRRYFAHVFAQSDERFVILPTMRAENGAYLVHAPLERVLAELESFSTDSGTYLEADISSVVVEIKLDAEYDQDVGRLVTSYGFGFAAGDRRYRLTLSRHANLPGVFGAVSQQAPGHAQWREALIGDQILSMLLNGEIDSLRRELQRATIGGSQRALLRRELLLHILRPISLDGSVWLHLDFVSARSVIERNRGLLESMSTDDPLYITALNKIIEPLFKQRRGNRPSDIVENAQQSYYAGMFAEEYAWAAQRFPQLVVETDYGSQQRAPAGPSDMSQLFDYYADLLLATRDEQYPFEQLLRQNELSRIDEILEDVATPDMPPAVWLLLTSMQRVRSATFLPAMGAAFGDRAASSPPITETAEWDALAQRWIARVPRRFHAPMNARLAQIRKGSELLLNLVGKLAELERLAAMPDVQDGFGHLNATLRSLAESADEAGLQGGDVALVLGALAEIGSDTLEPEAANRMALEQLDIHGEQNPVAAVLIGVALLEVASDGTDPLDPAVTEKLWTLFGPEGVHRDFWPGVALLRGALVFANDLRTEAVTFRIADRAGAADPPWLLPFYRRRSLSDRAILPQNAERRRDWIEIVNTYSLRERDRAPAQ